jgi:hypothetical protein
MRAILLSLVVWLIGVPMAVVNAEDRNERGDRVLEGVLGGLLGGPQQPQDAAYLAKERERLASLLQSGQYATSRQGEPIDTVILGVPLTRTEHVYTAKPVPPSQTSAP